MCTLQPWYPRPPNLDQDPSTQPCWEISRPADPNHGAPLAAYGPRPAIFRPISAAYAHFYQGILSLMLKRMSSILTLMYFGWFLMSYSVCLVVFRCSLSLSVGWLVGDFLDVLQLLYNQYHHQRHGSQSCTSSAGWRQKVQGCQRPGGWSPYAEASRVRSAVPSDGWRCGLSCHRRAPSRSARCRRASHAEGTSVHLSRTPWVS